MATNKEKLIEKFDHDLFNFYHHSLFKSMGFNSDDVRQPRIAIVNSWSEQSPAHIHFRELADIIKAGVRNAGGTPFEINVLGPCPSFGMDSDEISHLDLPTRELILNSIEDALRMGWCDGWIGLASCDKIVPAMLLAAIRLNRPCIIIPGGTMIPGHYNGDWFTFGKGLNLFFQKYGDKNVDEADFERLTSACGSCIGTCSEMTTGTTMQILTEAIGLALPYSSTVPSVFAEHRQLARTAGRQIIELAKKKIKPSDIITEESIKNAIKVDMAVCGSTNTLIHLQALAYEAKLNITLDTWDQISKEIFPICPISPSGPFTVADLHKAGGIPAIMKELSGKLNLDCLTVTGKKVWENIKDASIKNSEVIYSCSKPLSQQGAIKVLRGNLAPRGAIVRQTVITNRELLNHRFNARVFNCHKDALGAILAGEIKPHDAIVLRYEGPKGGPAMAEMYFIVTAVKKVGVKDIAVITDGRFSGFTQGMVAIGHVCPEAYVGGPLAFVVDGDVIHVDIPNGKLELEVDASTLESRQENWQPPKKDFYKGILAIYRNNALQADQGAGWPTEAE